MVNEESSTRRPDILIHWTGGKKIESEYRKTGDKATRRNAYIEWLSDTLRGGLWMNFQEMEVLQEDTRKYEWPGTCFAEIEPSEALDHAKRYGYLGYGFKRQFVMKRYGAPLLYVSGPREEEIGAMDVISNHIVKLSKVLGFLKEQTLKHVSGGFPLANYESKREGPSYCFSKFIDDCHFADFFQNYDKRKPELVFAALEASITSLAIFVKKMSDAKSEKAFHLLDEAEWRIPYTRDGEGRGYLKKTGKKEPPFRIPFNGSDLKLLILLDDKTRAAAYQDPYIVQWLESHKPKVMTVDELRDSARECAL